MTSWWLGLVLQVQVLPESSSSAAKQFALLILPHTLHQHVQAMHMLLLIPMLVEAPPAYYA
jgi:hypothetical protein